MVRRMPYIMPYAGCGMLGCMAGMVTRIVVPAPCYASRLLGQVVSGVSDVDGFSSAVSATSP